MFSEDQIDKYLYLQDLMENFFCQDYVSIMYLKCSNNESAVCLDRLKKRSRSGESKVQIEYMDELIKKSDEFFDQWSCSKLLLASNDFFYKHIDIIDLFIRLNIQKKSNSKTKIMLKFE
jgi:hypothetical protein